MKIIKKTLLVVGLFLIGYFLFNAFGIYRYASNYSEQPSDVAIVLGAGTNGGKLSPVFRERINHGITLYRKGVVKQILFTGGFGQGQQLADSEVAKRYALKEGVPENAILIETRSKFTFENMIEAKSIMDSLHLETALIVSDPLHMKRSMTLAAQHHISCQSSPTPTTMYRSFRPKLGSLFYETVFYCFGTTKWDAVKNFL